MIHWSEGGEEPIDVLTLPNRRQVACLHPEEVVVVPEMVGYHAAQGIATGGLRTGVVSVVLGIVDLQELAVAVTLTGERAVACQPMRLGPMVNDWDVTDAIPGQLLDADLGWLPRFFA